MKKVLLISDMAPTSEFTAGIVLERLIEFCARSLTFSVIAIVDPALPNYKVSKYLAGAKVKWLPKPVEDWSRFANLPKHLIKIGERLSKSDSEKILNAILREVSRDKPDHLLLVIQGQTTINLYFELQKLGIPSTYIHWDDWSWWSRAHYVSETQDLITKIQLKSLNENGIHIVPTDEFAENLTIDTERSVTLFPSLTVKYHEESKIDNKNIDIVFVGKNYASSETAKFLEALDSAEWEVLGKKIVLHHYGSSSIDIMSKKATVIEEGWYDYRFLPRAISSFDLAFLPYSESEEMKIVSRTSFPSKFASYISAGLPVLYIGEKDAFVAKLVNLIGATWSKNDSNEEIINSIAYLVETSRDKRADRLQIYKKYFSELTFSLTLLKWLEKANMKAGIMTLEKGMPIGSGSPIRHFENISQGKYISILYFKSILILSNPKIFLQILKNITKKVIYKIYVKIKVR